MTGEICQCFVHNIRLKAVIDVGIFFYYSIYQSKLIHSKIVLRAGSVIELNKSAQRGKFEFKNRVQRGGTTSFFSY